MASKRKRDDDDDDALPVAKHARLASDLHVLLDDVAPLATRPGLDETIKIFFYNRVVYVDVAKMATKPPGLLRAIADGRIPRQPDGSVVADTYVHGTDVAYVADGLCDQIAVSADRVGLERLRLHSYETLLDLANPPEGVDLSAATIAALTRQVQCHAYWHRDCALRDSSHVVINMMGTEFHLSRRALAGFTFFDLTIDTDHERDWVVRPLVVMRDPLMFSAVLNVSRGLAYRGYTAKEILDECIYYQLEATASVDAAITASADNLAPLTLLAAASKCAEKAKIARRVIERNMLCAWPAIKGISAQEGLEMAVSQNCVPFAKKFGREGGRLTKISLLVWNVLRDRGMTDGAKNAHTQLCVAMVRGQNLSVAYMVEELGMVHPSCKCSYVCLAARHGMLDALKRACRDKKENVNWKCPVNDRSPLDYALRNGHVACAMHLIDHGASVDGWMMHAIWSAESLRAMIPLYRDKGTWAQDLREVMASMQWKRATSAPVREVWRILLAEGADVNAVTHRTKTCALARACYIGDTDSVKFLLEHGAVPTLAHSFDVDEPTCIDALVSAGADVNALRPGGTTVLQHMVVHGHVKTARHLVENYSANVHTRGAKGCSALFSAVAENHADLVTLFAYKPTGVPLYPEHMFFAAVDRGNVHAMEILDAKAYPTIKIPTTLHLMDCDTNLTASPAPREVDIRRLISRIMRGDNVQKLQLLVKNQGMLHQLVQLALEARAFDCFCYLFGAGHVSRGCGFDPSICTSATRLLCRVYTRLIDDGRTHADAGKGALDEVKFVAF